MNHSSHILLTALHKRRGLIHQTRNNDRHDCGVTLIEMLVALVIMTLIVGSVYVAFDSGKQSWQVGDALMQKYQNARGILDVMSREISTAMVDAMESPFNIYCIGRADAFYFTGPLKSIDVDNVDVSDNLYRSGYWCKSSTNKGERPGVLMRGFECRNSSPPYYTFAGLSNNPLGVHVKDLEFQYYDSSSGWCGEGVDWKSGVGSNELPGAIEIKLTVEDESATKSRVFRTVVTLQNAE